MICDLEAKHIACHNFRVDSRYRLILLRTVPVICPHDALGNRFSFKLGEDGNVMGFLYLNKDKNIKVNYQGERPYSITMTAADRQALASIYELAQLLSSMTEIKKNMEEANLKIEFVKKKMEERKDNAQE